MARKNGKTRLGRFKIRLRSKPGAAPGAVVPHPDSPPPVIRVIAYGPEDLVDKNVKTPQDLPELLGKHVVCWINVDGLGDAAVIREIGEIFGLHRLAMEDVVNVHQRPKVEEYPDHLYMVARMVSLNHTVQTEQISLFLGKNYVLTFQERQGDCLDLVRKRLRDPRRRIRNSGPDYLAYAILDAVIDGYYPVLDRFSDILDELDEQVQLQPARETVTRIHDTRRELLLLRRAITPHRDALAALRRESFSLVSGETQVYLRDCYDHTVQSIELVESYREICSHLHDIYLSVVGHRMNEVMKVLTIIATIFIPLSFIAGVYGMNFDFMPETKWKWGYPLALTLMGALAGGLMGYFWKRGWLRSG